MLSVAQGLVLTETEDVTAEPLLNTSEQSYSKQDVNNAATTEKESGDTDGPLHWPPGHATTTPGRK